MFAPDAFDALYPSKETRAEGKNERKLISLKSSEIVKELKKQMHETNRLVHLSNSKHKRQQFTLHKRHSNVAKAAISTNLITTPTIDSSISTSTSNFGESKSENVGNVKSKRQEWSTTDIVRQFREAKSVDQQLAALTNLADHFRETMIADTLDDRIIVEVIESGLVDDLLTIIASKSCTKELLTSIFTTFIDLTSCSEKSKCSQLLLERGIVSAVKWLIPMFVQGRFSIQLCDHFMQIIINLSCDQESCSIMVAAKILEPFAHLALNVFKTYQLNHSDKSEHEHEHDCDNSSSTDSDEPNLVEEILCKMSYIFLNFCRESEEENASSFVPLLAILEAFFLLPDKVICDNVAECIEFMASQEKDSNKLRLKLITSPKCGLCKRLVENFVPTNDDLEDENFKVPKVMEAVHALVSQDDSEYSSAVVKEPQFFSALVMWLDAKSVVVREAAYLILSNVAADSIELKKMIISREGLLVQICAAMECKSKNVRHHAATTFANLFCVYEGDERSEQHVQLIKFFLDGKGIKRLCTALDYGYEKDVQLRLLFVAEGILNITNCNRQVVQQFEEFGFIDHLEELRSHETIDVISNTSARMIEKIEDAKEIFEQQDLL